jgi:hypothetical protein
LLPRNEAHLSLFSKQSLEGNNTLTSNAVLLRAVQPGPQRDARRSSTTILQH